MLREDNRDIGDGYCVQLLAIKGDVRDDLSHMSYYIENISKGGFRFISDIVFEIDDQLQVLLRFPDGHSQKVLGRICYCDEDKGPDGYAYGFSVLDGFYSLNSSVASG
jgi:hypothetical protein